MQIRQTKNVSVFKVGFAGGVYYEGPVCDENGRVKEWHSPSAEWRYGNRNHSGAVEPQWSPQLGNHHIVVTE